MVARVPRPFAPITVHSDDVMRALSPPRRRTSRAARGEPLGPGRRVLPGRYSLLHCPIGRPCTVLGRSLSVGGGLLPAQVRMLVTVFPATSGRLLPMTVTAPFTAVASRLAVPAVPVIVTRPVPVAPPTA